MAGPAACDCAGRNSRRPIALLRRQQFGAAPKFCETYRLESSFEDYQELLRDRDLDAAIICLPNFLHFPASLASLEAGKPRVLRNPRQ